MVGFSVNVVVIPKTQVLHGQASDLDLRAQQVESRQVLMAGEVLASTRAQLLAELAACGRMQLTPALQRSMPGLPRVKRANISALQGRLNGKSSTARERSTGSIGRTVRSTSANRTSGRRGGEELAADYRGLCKAFLLGAKEGERFARRIDE